MRYLLLSSVVLFVVGCQGMPGSGDFYTWVDETGQIRTVKKNPIQESSKQPQLEGAQQNKESNDFDPNDFTPSDQIDKKLSNQKLYAWQETDGRQIVAETQYSPSAGFEPLSGVLQRIKPVRHIEYREGQQYLLSDINGKALDLARYYRFNQTTQADYLLIELDVLVSKIELKSFAQHGAIALPQLLPLDESFKQHFQFESTFNQFQGETWLQYGHAQADLLIPTGVKYLLIRPSEQVGMLKLGEESFKISNLGQISIRITE